MDRTGNDHDKFAEKTLLQKKIALDISQYILYGGFVVSMFASYLWGLIAASALHMWSLHVLPMIWGFPPGFSGFLPQSKQMHCRLIGI